MKRLEIQGDKRKPSVLFDADKGVLQIKGRSTTENSLAFFQPLHQWVCEYSKRPAKGTQVDIHLDYFNTSTSRWLFKILKSLEVDKNAKVNWYYSDEDIMEAGKDLNAIVDLPFNLIKG